jgi:hypothetical protein
MTKKPRSIESLLKWSYAEELPKDAETSFLRPDGFGFGWGSVTEFGRYMTDVQTPDIVNRFGVTPDMTARTGPHPDAVRIHLAVLNLDGLDFELPEDWHPLSDICPIDGALGAEGLAATSRGLRQISIVDGTGRRRLTRSIAEFLRTRAILGPPGWQGETPKLRYRTAADGRHLWFIRECVTTATGSFEIERQIATPAKKKGPKAGSYRKTFLDPDPCDLVHDRAEYQLYCAALGFLIEDLKGRLDEWEPTESGLPFWPWEDGDRPSPRILVDMRPQQPIMHEPRPIAGPPLKRGITKRDEAA